MKDQAKLIVGVTFTTGVVAHALLNSIKVHRRERAKREQLERDKILDMEAIRRAGDKFSQEVQTGIHDHLSLGQTIALLHTRIEFEKIAVRLEN